MKVFKWLSSFLSWLFEPPKKRLSFASVVVVDSTDNASKVIKTGKLVLVGTSQKYKWLRFLCPCGCGEVQALNLMRSHHPHWTVQIHEDATLTIHPSVDAKKCGAHFWVRRNKITWC